MSGGDQESDTPEGPLSEKESYGKPEEGLWEGLAQQRAAAACWPHQGQVRDWKCTNQGREADGEIFPAGPSSGRGLGDAEQSVSAQETEGRGEMWRGGRAQGCGWSASETAVKGRQAKRGDQSAGQTVSGVIHKEAA